MKLAVPATKAHTCLSAWERLHDRDSQLLSVALAQMVRGLGGLGLGTRINAPDKPHVQEHLYDSEPKALTAKGCPASVVVLVLGIGGMRLNNHATGQREFQASRRPDELCKSQSQASIKLLRWADESDLHASIPNSNYTP